MKQLLHLPNGAIPLGDLIKQDLASGIWTEFRAAVAFARLSGVNQLAHPLSQFATTGKAILSIGVKDLPTTAEALTKLLSTVGPSGEIWIFHQEKGPTFHPKAYLFGNKTHVKVYIGSGNLTGGGLYENYEAFLCNTLDRAIDSQLIADIEAMFISWSSQSSICNQLSPSLIASLLREKYILTEKQANKASRSQKKKQKKAKHPLFGTQPTPKAPRVAGQHSHPPQQGNPPTGSRPTTPATSFWFQTGAMTSGSRNQLDFSKQGRNGNIGGISLFGLNPNNTSSSITLTIEYLGVDYHPNTIIYGVRNGTWRIQFSGRDSANNHLAQISKNNFRYKLLVFHKINSTKYRLECLPQSQLPALKARSIWTDQNPGTNGREYGRLT